MSEMFFGAGAVRPGVQPEIRCPERTDGVVHITAYPVFPGLAALQRRSRELVWAGYPRRRRRACH